MDSKLSTNSLYLLHLISCAPRDTTPSALPQDASWDVVFQLAERNSVTTTCAFAVAKVPGTTDEERSCWQSKVDSNLMRHAIFDMERERIYEEMDAAGLAHASLKGILTSQAYPRPEMRWMCDNDFLFGKPQPDGTVRAAAGEDARELRGIMEHLGYKTEAFGTGNHDSYQKPPFLNIEPHRQLANPEVDWWQYYANPWAHTHKTPNGMETQRELPLEDTYLFHIVHMFKHYSSSGHGVRGLADEWVLMNAWGPKMDRNYLNAELVKLGMRDFERDLRRVSESVIGSDTCGQVLAGNAAAIPQQDERMLAYMLSSGTYGTLSNNVNNKLAKEAAENGQKGSRARYLLHRVFPPLSNLAKGYPVLKRVPWLLPGVYAYRLIVKPFTRFSRLRTELMTVAKSDGK